MKNINIRHHATTLPWKKIGIIALIAAPMLMIAVQWIYPQQAAMLYAKVDGVSISGMKHDEALAVITKQYNDKIVDVSFGNSSKPYRSPALKALGAKVDSSAVDAAMYPWWLRMIPTSLWWGHFLAGDKDSAVSLDKAKTAEYVTQELGESCNVAPKNASAEVKGDAIVRVAAEDGGVCKLEDVTKLLQDAKPTLRSSANVRVPMTPVTPAVTNEKADELIATVESRLKDGVILQQGAVKETLDAKIVRSWLKFDNSKDTLTASLDGEKAKEVLLKQVAPKVDKKPGVVTITTNDFIELSRTGGGNGQALNVSATVDNITKYLTGDAKSAEIATTSVPAEKKYIRTYSSTDQGLSALMKNFAETHSGVYGVSLIELSGKGRRAEYNQGKVFFPASTYKVFVAYSTLKQVEAGKMSWSDQIANTGGRNLEKCFNDMIVISDNACPEELMRKIGVRTLNADAAAIGLRQTRFIAPGQHQTTAGDLSVFMASLQTGQLSISGANRSKFLDALNRNIYRKGIPAGASGKVADKVGFIDALLHDTAIVYSPSGTYVLTIMTDGSSWGNIAELTRQIEKLRSS